MALPTDRTPTHIGRFVVESVLGSGGMGAVYKAHDPNLKRTVAVNTVRPDISQPDFLQRLVGEAQACARLHHPHIVTVHEAGEIDGAVYVVMEYLEGEDLAQALWRSELPFETRIRMLIQILEALEHAHAHGVIHRDIKPANIRVLTNGSIKIVDFGLARVSQVDSRTVTGTIMGTLHYASPEQLRGERVDARTDIYSTGTMAYELCCGRRPFDGPTASTIIIKVISEPLPPMEVQWSRAFPEIERIIARAMSKSAADRYQSAEDMRNALTAFLASSRDRIPSVEAQDTIVAQQSLIEAQTLISGGRGSEARSFLAETLKRSPHAPGVRQMLDQLPPPADGDVTIPSVRPPVVSDTPQEPRLTDLGKSTAAWERTPGGQTATIATDPSKMTVPPRPRWLVPAAAAMVLALIGVSVYLWSPSPEAPVTTIAGNPTPEPPTPAPEPKAPEPQPPIAPPPTTGDGTRETAPPPVGVKAKAEDPKVTAPPVGDTVAPKLVSPPAPVPTAVPTPVAAPAGGREMFYSSGDKSSPAPNTGLRYRISQQSKQQSEVDVDLATAVFRNGDKVRMSFESNTDGYLYVVQQGSSGRWSVLFPSPEINSGRNGVRSGEEYKVPNDGWFEFDANPGVENLFVYFSKEPMQTLPGFERPVTKPETLTASAVNDLRNTIASRDLSYGRDPKAAVSGGKLIQANYVVNRSELGKAVSANITLRHEP